MKFYIVMQDGAERPYVTTIRPTKERQTALLEQGCELFETDVEIPGWKWEHGKVTSVAKPLEEG